MLKSKSEDSIKKYNLISSENIRQRQDINDLSRQVTTLLHEVEKLRTKLISQSRQTGLKGDEFNKSYLNASYSNESTAEVSSSSEVISKDLLLFRYDFNHFESNKWFVIYLNIFFFDNSNIEELQKQNQKLVRLVHEITDKKQSEEKLELETRYFYGPQNIKLSNLWPNVWPRLFLLKNQGIQWKTYAGRERTWRVQNPTRKAWTSGKYGLLSFTLFYI